MITKMLAKLRFNQDIDKEKEYIGLGGYCIISNGETYYFDFFQFIGNIDKDDRAILLCEMTELDYIQNEDFDEIEIKDSYFEDIELIDEFTVCVNSDSTLEVIDILELKFVTDEGREIVVNADVLEKANINMTE